MSTQQLQMVWPAGKLVNTTPPLSADYRLRSFQAGDDAEYIRLMRAAGFTTWGQPNLDRVLSTCLPQGVFFVQEPIENRLVATACATHSPREFHPMGGELGWVAVDPDHRGKGLGALVCTEVVRLFLTNGYQDLYLLTDDFRLPAIKIYLQLGWVPFLHAEDMLLRWQAVCRQLEWDFDPNLARKPEGL